MAVDGINLIKGITPSLTSEVTEERSKTDGPSFISVLQDAINEVNVSQINAQNLARDFALGRVENIHTVTIAAQKAELALDLTVAIRNKIMDAYQEIMRMQF
ncbi:MAG: flagellar hook-basal body complex protein FliE [Halanaerobium sp.]|nr:flagellar hook-basal body complex protein FliE [Halanaerobium sp.]